MKFIIRNLGWILLIIFFVFMLYLISTQNNVNNNAKVNTNTGVLTNTGVIINTGSNLDSKDLDSEKNEKIEVKEVIEENGNEIISNEINLALISGEEKDIKQTNTGSFIQKIKDFFSFNTDKKENNQKIVDIKNTSNTGVVDEELINKVNKIIDGNNKITKNNIKLSTNKEKNIKKIAVKSVFLNNAYFTKRLYTAYKGDKLEQLTPTNKYGCFKVKVISSKDTRNNGKIAWTCEYYMEGKIANLQKYKQAAQNYYKQIKNNRFSINSTHKIKVKSLKLNNANFNKKLGVVYYGDSIKQLTPTNKYGCFQVKVISSKNPRNNGKIAWVCKKYLK